LLFSAFPNVKGPLPDLAKRALITGELWSLTWGTLACKMGLGDLLAVRQD
jgi:hypothetical protein